MSDAPKETSMWLVWAGRIGYTAKGLVYLMAGILAWRIAVGTRNESQGTGQGAALDAISGIDGPFGTVLMVAICIGLLFYGFWRWMEAIFDPANYGNDCKAIAKRTAYAIQGTIYVVLGFGELVSVIQDDSGSGGNGNSTWTQDLMDKPFGRWLVGFIGGVLVALGLYFLKKAWTMDFMDALNLSSVSSSTQTWIARIGRGGYFAKSVSSVLLGAFVIAAAVRHGQQQQTMITFLLDQPYGSALVALVGTCIFFYGIFCLVIAKYRKVFRNNSEANKHDSDSQEPTAHGDENV